MGISNGAIASSVAHDCHNIITIGKTDDDMALAVNKIIEMGGGFCVVSEGKILATLPLIIAGLMSAEKSEQIIELQKEIKSACSKIGVSVEEPFLQMAFLALPVIPTIKLTDKGFFDFNSFSYINIKE
jgi:adenine deaminase